MSIDLHFNKRNWDRTRKKMRRTFSLDAVFNHPGGARYYGRRARELGASEAQVVEAIKLLRIFAGRPAMVTAAEGLRDE